MTLRQSMAVSAAPVFLRLALAVVFLWAGVGKLQPASFSPEQAARLANMGERGFLPQAPPAAPSAPATTPSGQGAAMPLLALAQQQQEPAEQEQPAEKPAEQPVEQPAEQTPSEQPAEQSEQPSQADEQQTQPATTPKIGLTAADYAGPVQGRQLFHIALLVDAAAHPDDGVRAIWPASMAKGRQPIWIAWAVALTEIAGGALVLVGALARLAGLALAGVMLGAAWLTSIGPYLLGGQQGWLGVLPPADNFQAWQTLLLQLTVFCCAMALFCTGAGWLSVDRLVFGKPGGAKADDDADELD